jgi:hypothetical protein
MPPLLESLEPRQLLSADPPLLAVGPVIADISAPVNISRMAGNQSEGAVAIDPTNPRHLVAVSNLDRGTGLLAADSSDGGATWSTKVIADGNDELPDACCDPSVGIDSFGNVFLSYINAAGDKVVVARGTGQANSFTVLTTFSGDVDQPTLTVPPGGEGTVWITFQKGSQIIAASATVSGLGEVGIFSALKVAPGSGNGNFGDIAVGPAGQVAVAYQNTLSDQGNQKIFVNVDADGAGPRSFGGQTVITSSNVGALDQIPAQLPNSIDAEVGLAFDNSGGPFRGRLYAVYTDETPDESDNTDILLRFSDNQGATWSAPQRVNDDLGLNSQFLPRLAVDPTSGLVGITWYDARGDTGVVGPESTDDAANDDVQMFGAVGTPTASGVDFSANVKISRGPTNSSASNNDIGLGDYTANAFDGGVLHVVWADNSNSTADNPNGRSAGLNLYTAAITPESTPIPPPPPAAGGPAAVFVGKAAVRKGTGYSFKVVYTSASASASAAGVDLNSLDSSDIVATGPNGFSQAATVGKIKKNRRGTRVTARYSITAPSGRWTAADNGTYTLALQGGQVFDTAAIPAAAAAATLGTFIVRAR